MSLIHVNPKTGKIGTCKASSPASCPFGLNNHFSTTDEAIERADELKEASVITENLKEYFDHPYAILYDWGKDEVQDAQNLKDILRQTTYDSMSDEELAELLDVGINGKFPKGILNELHCIREEQRFLEDVLPTKMIIPSALKGEEKEKYDKIIRELLPNTKLKNPVYAIFENEEQISVWNKDHEDFDYLSYTKDGKYKGRITKSEIKDLQTSAQITAFDLESTGSSLKCPSSPTITTAIEQEILEYNPLKDWRGNKVLDISEDEALGYFIKAHGYNKCTKLWYVDKNGQNQRLFLASGKYWDSKLSDETKLENDLKTFKDKNLSVKLWIRLNKESKKVKQKDIDHFREYYAEIFKDGVIKDSFTIKDLDHKKIKLSESHKLISSTWNRDDEYIQKYTPEVGVVRFGEFVYKGKDVKPDRVFHISEFERYIPKLMGEIFIKE